jgi:hypothetical protein
MFIAEMLALQLVHFTGPDKQLIEINPDEVVSIREPRDSEQHFHEHVNCLIFTSDGKFSGVVEECSAVEQKLIGAGVPPDAPALRKQ